MKKFILMMLAVMVSFVSANAQIARETQKPLDNVYVFAGVGATTPLSMNHVFPLNMIGTLKLGKEFTPVWGANIEGTAVFGDNAVVHPFTTETFVKAIYVGANVTTNWSNLLCGYKGTPRFFEVSSEIGLGWIHEYKNGVTDDDDLGAKTGLNFAFNLGKSRAWTVNVNPAVYWNLTSHNEEITMCKNGAQLALTVGVAYHFKTSNGTHAFVLYDVGALNDKINNLRAELAKKPKEVVKTVTNTTTIDNSEWVVFFAQKSADLTADAKNTLDKVKTDKRVKVIATASPEGTEKFNQQLSQKRAETVAKYLESKGITVESAEGLGITGKASNRVAIVTVNE